MDEEVPTKAGLRMPLHRLHRALYYSHLGRAIPPSEDSRASTEGERIGWKPCSARVFDMQTGDRS